MAPRLTPHALHLLTVQSGVIATWQPGAPSNDAMLRAHKQGTWRRVTRYTYLASPALPDEQQRRWAAVLHFGPGAVLSGRSALVLAGWGGGEGEAIHVLVTAHDRRGHPPWILPRRSAYRPAIARSLPARATPPEAVVDAATAAKTPRQAVFLVLSVLQARLASTEDIRRILTDRPKVRRRRLILETVAEYAEGITTMGERDFARICREYGIRTPDRQVRRRDAEGRFRYLDARFEAEGIVVEIDGLGHLDLEVWMDDHIRQNDIVVDGRTVVMRTSTVALRHSPDQFMNQLVRALRIRGN